MAGPGPQAAAEAAGLMAKAPKVLPTWRIIEMANKGRLLGIVRAADADAAIKVAIKQFVITDPHHTALSSETGRDHCQNDLGVTVSRIDAPRLDHQ